MVTTEVLRKFANELLADSNTPDQVRRTAEWFLNGSISDDEFFNAVSYYANINTIQSQIGIQQAIQLTAVGESITGGAEKDVEQDNSIAALWANQTESFAFATGVQDQLNAVNTRLSAQVVELGQSQGTNNFFENLGIGFGGFGIGAIAVLGLGAFILLRK